LEGQRVSSIKNFNVKLLLSKDTTFAQVLLDTGLTWEDTVVVLSIGAAQTLVLDLSPAVGPLSESGTLTLWHSVVKTDDAISNISDSIVVKSLTPLTSNATSIISSRVTKIKRSRSIIEALAKDHALIAQGGIPVTVGIRHTSLTHSVVKGDGVWGQCLVELAIVEEAAFADGAYKLSR